MNKRLSQQLEFLIEIDKVKSVFRKTKLIHEDRYENDAEHAWHFAMYAMILVEYAEDDLDISKVLRIALIHDLVEIDAGDTIVYDKEARQKKQVEERIAAERIFGLLPTDQGEEFKALWEEFECRQTPESKFAAALDRVQPIIHNINTQGVTWLQHGITKEMVLETNQHIAQGSQQLWDVIKNLVQQAAESGYLKE
jgi:putative hydrolase of HD superfamily